MGCHLVRFTVFDNFWVAQSSHSYANECSLGNSAFQSPRGFVMHQSSLMRGVPPAALNCLPTTLATYVPQDRVSGL